MTHTDFGADALGDLPVDLRLLAQAQQHPQGRLQVRARFMDDAVWKIARHEASEKCGLAAFVTDGLFSSLFAVRPNVHRRRSGSLALPLLSASRQGARRGGETSRRGL